MKDAPSLRLDFLDASEHATYRTKVQELAQRGFRLQSLLTLGFNMLKYAQCLILVCQLKFC